MQICKSTIFVFIPIFLVHQGPSRSPSRLAIIAKGVKINFYIFWRGFALRISKDRAIEVNEK